MRRKKTRRSNRRRNLAIGAAGLSSAAALGLGYKALTRNKAVGTPPRRASSSQTAKGNPTSTPKSPTGNTRSNQRLTTSGRSQQRTSYAPAQQTIKLSPSQRRDRGFGRLTKKQSNRLRNHFGYDIEKGRFNPNVSISKKKKGKDLIRSLGRFRRRSRLALFG